MSAIPSKKLKEKNLGDVAEEIDVMGQESEEVAAKWVKEVNKENDKIETNYNDDLSAFFDKAKHKTVKTYKELLAQLMYYTIRSQVDFPDGWKFYVGYSEKGVAVKIWHDKYGEFGRGFNPIGDQKYDLNAVNILIHQLENTLAGYEPRVESPVDEKVGDILIADEEDHGRIKAGVDSPAEEGKKTRKRN